MAAPRSATEPRVPLSRERVVRTAVALWLVVRARGTTVAAWLSTMPWRTTVALWLMLASGRTTVALWLMTPRRTTVAL